MNDCLLGYEFCVVGQRQFERQGFWHFEPQGFWHFEPQGFWHFEPQGFWQFEPQGFWQFVCEETQTLFTIYIFFCQEIQLDFHFDTQCLLYILTLEK
jgi:hypothetical protein